MTAETPVWLEYIPGGLVQERARLVRGYEIWMPELQLEVGRVELYLPGDKRGVKSQRWRTLDHWLCDFEDEYETRELAAQDLLRKCHRTRELIRRRRDWLAARPESKNLLSAEAAATTIG